MRYERPIYLAGTGVWLADKVSVADAEQAGLVDQDHIGLGYETICVDEPGTAPPDMAIQAGRQAVERAAISSSEYGIHLHAHVWFQGLDCWSPAPYIASRTSGSQAFPIELDQRSNGGMAALHLALGYMHGGAARAALVTTADRFAAPEIDRWNSYPQAILADGGTALTLSTRSGFAKAISSVEVAATALERWDRGIAEFATAPLSEVPVQVQKRIAGHVSSPEAQQELVTWAKCVTRTGEQALTEAETRHEDIRYTVFPFMHRGQGLKELHDLVGFTEEQTIWPDYGRHVGHLGAGDALAGLNYLVEHGGLASGDRILLYGSGIGFTYTATVLEVVATP